MISMLQTTGVAVLMMISASAQATRNNGEPVMARNPSIVKRITGQSMPPAMKAALRQAMQKTNIVTLKKAHHRALGNLNESEKTSRQYEAASIQLTTIMKDWTVEAMGKGIVSPHAVAVLTKKLSGLCSVFRQPNAISETFHETFLSQLSPKDSTRLGRVIAGGRAKELYKDFVGTNAARLSVGDAIRVIKAGLIDDRKAIADAYASARVKANKPLSDQETKRLEKAKNWMPKAGVAEKDLPYLLPAAAITGYLLTRMLFSY